MRRFSIAGVIVIGASVMLGQPAQRCDWSNRSVSLVSSDGRRAAHVRTSASENADDVSCCIVDEGLVREHAPDEPSLSYRGGSGTWLMKLVDWSPDGKRLLIEEQEMICNGDWADTRITLWDDAAAKVTILDIAPILERHPARGDCYVEVLPVGFLPDGRVVISSQQETTIDSERCTEEMREETRWWAWSPADGAVARLGASATIRRYGTIRLPR